jgi:hypothetical protein
MRILFDHGTPSGIASALEGHTITEAMDRGWDQISNGELLRVAEEAGFELLLTTDKNLRYQQNLGRPENRHRGSRQFNMALCSSPP